MIIEGTFLPYKNQPNGNGRIYTKESIDSSCFSNYFNKVDKGIAFGECSILHHPAYIDEGIVFGECSWPTLPNDNISLDNISHKINDLYEDDNGIHGSIEVLSTSLGEFVSSFLESGGKIAIRPRMIGYPDQNGNMFIKEIISFDIVNELNDAFNARAYKNKRFFLRDLKNNKNG